MSEVSPPEGSARVAVVVPAYNASPYIEPTLLSALGQTYENIEIVVVDDGSTDDTASIVQRLADRFANLRLISIRNGGSPEARNLGMAATDAEYIAFLDADDLWQPTKIEKQMAALTVRERDPEWIGCYSLVRLIDEQGKIIDDAFPWQVRGAFFDEQIFANPMICGSNLLVRRDVALSVGGFDSAYIQGCEDLDFHLRLLARGKIELVEEYLVGYRLHDEQITGEFQQIRLSEASVIDAAAKAFPAHRAALRKGRVHAAFKVVKGAIRIGRPGQAVGWFVAGCRASWRDVPAELWRIVRHEASLWAYRRQAADLRSARQAEGSFDFMTYPSAEPFDQRQSHQSSHRHQARVAHWFRALQNDA